MAIRIFTFLWMNI